MEIMINIPEQCFFNHTTQEMARNIKLYSALLMFQSGQLSAGAACEFADVDRYAFIAACKQHHISVIEYDENDIKGDLDRLNRGSAAC